MLTESRRLSLRPLIKFAVLGLASLCAGGAFAQAYPNRPITVYWPSVAGSSTDNTLRALMAEVSKRLGQTVVFENRPGANGTLGLIAMRNARPDGYTLNIAPHGPIVQLPHLDPNFKYELGRDFVPISFILEFPLVIGANPGVPFNDVKGMIEYAKANPRKINFAVQQGTVSHLFAELVCQTAGIEMTMVPYKSSTAALPDLFSGVVQLAVSNTNFKPMVEAGKVKTIAVSSRERWSPFPTVPTLVESGLPVVDASWYFLAAASGTPPEIQSLLAKVFSESMKTPEVLKRYAGEALVSHPDMTSKELAERIEREYATWGTVIRKAGIKLQ